MDNGEIDCIWGCFSMDGREQDYQWAGPYMVSRQVIAVNAKSDIYAMGDLNGKTIAVQSIGKPEEIFLQSGQADIPQFEDIISLEDRGVQYAALDCGYAYVPTRQVYDLTVMNLVITLVMYILILVLVQGFRWNSAKDFFMRQEHSEQEYRKSLEQKNAALEFAVIMVDMTSDLSYTIVDKISEVNRQLVLTEENIPSVSLSVGVAFADRGDPGESIFKDADSALYYTKERGRKGCSFYPV